VVVRRRIGVGLVALGLTFAPVVTAATRAHGQASDAEGADGGDVRGGDGGAGASGLLPNGNQNGAATGDYECFSDEPCALIDNGNDALAGYADNGLGDDPFATQAFLDEL
jgi:hypothetical protein